MNDIVLLLVILAALALGWRLGLWSAARRGSVSVERLPRSYMQSLTLLINDSPDQAIDQLLTEFAVNDDTFDTHIALGNVSRKRGELERAIRIHQNLLSRPTLRDSHHSTAHFELARDYLQAGLLDRAETLLNELIEKSVSYRTRARTLLMTLYEQEREWQSAIDIGKALLPRRLLRQRTPEEQKVALKLCHYYCELAEECLAQGDFDEARAYARHAAGIEKNSLRADYVLLKIAARTNDRDSLLRLSGRILRSDSKLLVDAKWLIDEILRGQSQAYCRQFLANLYERTKAVSILEKTFEYATVAEQPQLLKQLQTQLAQAPSLRAMSLWLRYGVVNKNVGDDARQLILWLIELLERSQKQHQCKQCGFQGVNFFWQCPTCKEWDSMELKAGDELDHH